jgi:hypothetical protein
MVAHNLERESKDRNSVPFIQKSVNNKSVFK